MGKKLWRAKEPIEDKLDEISFPSECVITGEMIRVAAKAFKKMTSNIEGMGPRHLGHMSEQLLGALAHLIMTAEIYGMYPGPLACKLVKLLAKKDGTSRPIMLLRTIYRVHSKVRKNVITG